MHTTVPLVSSFVLCVSLRRHDLLPVLSYAAPADVLQYVWLRPATLIGMHCVVVYVASVAMTLFSLPLLLTLPCRPGKLCITNDGELHVRSFASLIPFRTCCIILVQRWTFNVVCVPPVPPAAGRERSWM